MFELKKIAPAIYELAKFGGMRVPGLLIANEELLKGIEQDRSLEQVINVAHLPGIVGYSLAMPDIHWGYGFPIGGVAAMDAEKGVISPGGVGYDINCGVRMAILPLPFVQISERTRMELLQAIFERIPSGVGREHKKERGLSDRDYLELVEQGARWSIERGYGFLEDLDHIESNGCIDGGSIETISMEAQIGGANNSDRSAQGIISLKSAQSSKSFNRKRRKRGASKPAIPMF